jgi:cytidyltransferase-like protein
MNSKTVTIFGVFDGIHEGHRVFISDAKAKGDKLVAVVARDSVVEKLKGRLPLNNEADRIKSLLEVSDIDQVFLGDLDEGTYNILKEIKPDVIYLGYDQQGLFDSIMEAMEKGILPEMELVYGKPHKGDTMHSSLINHTNE